MTTDQTSVSSGELSEQEAQTAATQIAMRAGLRTLVECCNVVDERIGHAREVELGMMAGAGVVPGPFSRADDIGLDVALQAIEWARTEWGDAFTPPVLLRRLVAQGRLGKKSGQGFFAYPQPDEGEQTETVVLETRGKVAIAWLSKPPVNPLGPQMFADLMTTWEKVEANSKIKVLVIASSSNVVYSAGADLKAFAQLDVDGSADLVSAAHKVMRAFERGKTVTIAAVNGAALGGGFELALACDVRIAGMSASFGFPEILLGLLPGFGGTQRLKRLVGSSNAFAMMATGDSIGVWQAKELGLVNEVIADHDLFDTVMRLAERYAQQAPAALASIKLLADDPTLDAELATEQEHFLAAIASADAKEGIAAFLQKRKPVFSDQ